MQRPLSTVILFAGVIFLSFAEHLQAQQPKEITNSIGMKLVLIPKALARERTASTVFQTRSWLHKQFAPIAP